MRAKCGAPKAVICAEHPLECLKYSNFLFAFTGTQEERGLLAWKHSHKGEVDNSQLISKVYDLPFGIGTKYCAVSWFRYLPACPQKLPSGKKMDELKAAGQESSVKASLERDSEIGADTRM